MDTHFRSSTKTVGEDLIAYEKGRKLRHQAARMDEMRFLASALMGEDPSIPPYEEEEGETVSDAVGSMDISLTFVEILDFVAERGYVHSARDFSMQYRRKGFKEFLNKFHSILEERFADRGVNDVLGAGVWLSNNMDTELHAAKYELWFVAAFHYTLYNQFMDENVLMTMIDLQITEEAVTHIFRVHMDQLTAKACHVDWTNKKDIICASRRPIMISVLYKALRRPMNELSDYMYKGFMKLPRGNSPNHTFILQKAKRGLNGTLCVQVLTHLYGDSLKSYHRPELFTLSCRKFKKMGQVVVHYHEKNAVPPTYGGEDVKALIYHHRLDLVQKLRPGIKYVSSHYSAALDGKYDSMVDLLAKYPVAEEEDPTRILPLCGYGDLALLRKNVSINDIFRRYIHSHEKIESYVLNAVTNNNAHILKYIRKNFDILSLPREVLRHAVEHEYLDILDILGDIHKERGYTLFTKYPRGVSYMPLTKEKTALHASVYKRFMAQASIPIHAKLLHIESFFIYEDSEFSRDVIKMFMREDKALVTQTVLCMYSWVGIPNIGYMTFLGNMRHFPTLFETVPPRIRFQALLRESIYATSKRVREIGEALVATYFDNPTVHTAWAYSDKTYPKKKSHWDVPTSIRTLLYRYGAIPKYASCILVGLILEGEHDAIDALLSRTLIELKYSWSVYKVAEAIIEINDIATLQKIAVHPSTNLLCLLLNVIDYWDRDALASIIHSKRVSNYLLDPSPFMLNFTFIFDKIPMEKLLMSEMFKCGAITELNAPIYTTVSLLFDSKYYIREAVKRLPETFGVSKVGEYPVPLHLAISARSCSNVKTLMGISGIRSKVNVDIVLGLLRSEKKRRAVTALAINYLSPTFSEEGVSKKHYEERMEICTKRNEEIMKMTARPLQKILRTLLTHEVLPYKTEALSLMRNFTADPRTYPLADELYSFLKTSTGVDDCVKQEYVMRFD